MTKWRYVGQGSENSDFENESKEYSGQKRRSVLMCFPMWGSNKIPEQNENIKAKKCSLRTLAQGSFGLGVFATEDIHFDESLLILPQQLAIGEEHVIQVLTSESDPRVTPI